MHRTHADDGRREGQLDFPNEISRAVEMSAVGGSLNKLLLKRFEKFTRARTDTQIEQAHDVYSTGQTTLCLCLCFAGKSASELKLVSSFT